VNPIAIISAIRARGVRLIPDGSRILLDPGGKLPDHLRERFEGSLVEVMRLLRAEARLCSACGEPITAPPGTIPFARKTEGGDLLHGPCWAKSFEAEFPATSPNAHHPAGPSDGPRGAA
jgi:hypothetical protein